MWSCSSSACSARLRQFEDALNKLNPILHSEHVGPKARLLRARVALELQGPADAVKELQSLLNERDEIACQAHSLLARASLIMIQKGPTTWQGLSILSSLVLWLDRGYVGRTWAFLALSDLELDLLAFIQRCIACCLDLRVMDKQVIAAIVRGNKTISLA
jgi:hypothetical protein